MQKLLAKYIYKNYFELLKNDTLNLELARLGWVKPAVIPRQTILYGNRLIRKHLARTLKSFMTDFEFERILCQVGYYGPACTTTTTTTSTSTSTTTSTTTTTVTTMPPTPVNVDIFNGFSAYNITNITVGGFQVANVAFPITPGNGTTGQCIVSANATVVVTISGTGTGCIEFWGSADVLAGVAHQCLSATTAASYQSTGLVFNLDSQGMIQVYDGDCIVGPGSCP